MTRRPAAFLDRDGTLIEDTGFVRRVEDVRLLPGAARAVERLNRAGWAVVVVTNQSGIARGMLTGTEYQAVAARFEALLAEAGARLDATYMCPHHPDISGPCECRKPGLASYRAAIADLGLDPARSLWVGDRLSDLLPARALGGRGILVLSGEGPRAREAAEREGFGVADDVLAAVCATLDRT